MATSFFYSISPFWCDDVLNLRDVVSNCWHLTRKQISFSFTLNFSVTVCVNVSIVIVQLHFSMIRKFTVTVCLWFIQITSEIFFESKSSFWNNEGLFLWKFQIQSILQFSKVYCLFCILLNVSESFHPFEEIFRT